MKLTLIRHGITHGNKYGLYYGATDLPLLEEGVEELRERRLGYIYPTAPRYYTSPLQRTQQTLRQLYGAVDFTVVDGLREMNFGVFEMRTGEDLRQDEAFVAWSRRMSTDRCPEGESFADVRREGQLVIFGNGAAKCREVLPDATYINITPSARGLARLAQQRLSAGEVEDIAYFEPFYLKDFVVIPSKKKLL